MRAQVFATAATVEVRREWRDRKERGGACLFAVRYAPFAKHKKRKRNADRRIVQPAVLLARPRIQQDAHVYRRSTAVLTQGTAHPKGPAPGHASGDLAERRSLKIPRQGEDPHAVVAGVTRPHLSLVQRAPRGPVRNAGMLMP